ncbi:MAG: endonuclease MutS2 [Dehalococcoidales bacterium]|nr:endonuclease MutS2 [Dehalococcoidales bacterium]
MMDSKSLDMLEFPRIREMIAGYTAFSGGRELAENLLPRQDAQGILHLLAQTAEARQLLNLDQGFSIGDVTDIREKAYLAEKEGILEPLSLLEVRSSLAALHALRRYLKELAEDYPRLGEIAGNIEELRQIEKDIGSCIDPSGEVLDSASPALGTIRRQLRDTRSQILEKLEQIVRSPRGQRILQEDIITEREGRYVVLVKMENRHDIKGIVHDISNTEATVFIEPAITVGLGNAIRELVIEERREIERILRILSAGVGAHADDIARNIELAAELDLIMAKARFGRRIKGAEPVIIEADGPERTGYLKLVNARHPLLGENAVPFSVELGHDYSILVITGPNTGGKTVTLKTIGLLSLMAQAGIPIPADAESHLPVFDGVFADIGDEQSIEQTLSTFSWHMGNINRIVKQATGKSLVLLDELGTSTDPAEGSALARAILRYFLQRSTLAVATTHFSDLKAFAYATAGLENASLEFDPVNLTPTFQLALGIPGGSNAMATAARLGLPPERIDDARGMLTQGGQELETLLNNLMTEKQNISSVQKELDAERRRLQKQNAEMTAELERLKTEERHTIRQARDDIVREAAELNREIRQAAAEMRKSNSADRIEQARRTLADVREWLDSEAWQPPAGELPDAGSETISVGDTVRLREVGLTATVLSVSEESREVEIQAGRTKMRIGLDSVTKVTSTQAPIPPREVHPVARSAPRQLDLRGKRADEIEPLLDSYLNDAAQANLDEVRIIHGMATGTVRSIVRDFLSSHPLAKSYRAGERDEGGDGATVVRL